MNRRTLTLSLFTAFSLTFISHQGMAAPKASKVLKELSQLPPSTPGKCLKAGSRAPNIKLPLVEGGKWVLYDELKKGPAAIVFYRGGWCPYCNVQLRSYEDALAKLKPFKTRLVAISVDQADPELVAKPTEKLAFPVASDPDLKAINAYNVGFHVPDAQVARYKSHGIDLEANSGRKHHVIAVPTIVLVGQDKRVAWCYSNEDYTVRPAVSALEKKLAKLKTKAKSKARTKK